MTPVFDRQWDSTGLSDNDLKQLQSILLENPLAGDIIIGTGGARKIRFALSGTGKSGGLRVIYADMAHTQRTYLLLCYPKSKQDDLTPAQKKQITAAIKLLKGE